MSILFGTLKSHKNDSDRKVTKRSRSSDESEERRAASSDDGTHQQII